MGEAKGNSGLIAIIRIKGRVNIRRDVEYTLNLLRLNRKYSLAIYPKDLPGFEGMLEKIRFAATWGEISRDTLVELLKKRGRLKGNKRLTDELVKEAIGLESIEQLADKILSGEFLLHKQEVLKPVFRLHPPKKGFKRSTRRPFENGGELGYRGESINELIKRMI